VTEEVGAVKQTKWEYHVLIRDLVEEGASADAFAEVRRLGESGWELVSVNYLTAYAPSLEPAGVAAADEADVMARVRKRLNVTLARAGYVPATNGATGAAHATSSNGNGNGNGAVAAAPSPVRIDALPETRLEAWFKRPA
jgi:hypothetical protein